MDDSDACPPATASKRLLDTREIIDSPDVADGANADVDAMESEMPTAGCAAWSLHAAPAQKTTATTIGLNLDSTVTSGDSQGRLGMLR